MANLKFKYNDSIYSITDDSVRDAQLDTKVDKVEGKGLSTNDYTDEDKAIVDGVTGALAEKADTEDIPDLVSDNLAKGILGNETVLSTDNVPFVSKTMSTGKYQRKKFVGCSYVWNQLADESDFVNGQGIIDISVVDHKLSFTITSGSGYRRLSLNNKMTPNHVYFIYINDVTTGHNKTCNIGVYTKLEQPYATINRGVNNFIIKVPQDTTLLTTIDWQNFTENYSFEYDDIWWTDLTQLFGSTAIADYIYNLEQATAGAGVAKLRELGFFTEDYYAYDAGSIQSVDIKEYSVTGFNLWDEEWEVSNVPFNGANFQSKNIIKVFPNATYFIRNNTVHIGSRGVNIAYYDSNDNVISTDRIYTTSVTIPNNCYGIKFGFATNYYGTTYNNDICINLSDPARNGQYEPYHKTTYPLTPTELRGVPKIDANNNIYADGDEYASDGGHTENYDIVDLGTLDYSILEQSSTRDIFQTSISDIKPVTSTSQVANILCPIYEAVSPSTIWKPNTVSMLRANSTHAGFIVEHGIYETAADFKAAMSGVYLVYEKATPTTETLTSFDYPQSVGSLEEITDYKVEQEDRDVAIPTGHVTEYMGKGGEFTLPTLPETPSVLAFDGHNFFWKPETI